MQPRTRVAGSDDPARAQGQNARGVAWVAVLLLSASLAGCATPSRLASRSAPCVHGCPEAPAQLRQALESGNARAEVAMGLRESDQARLAGAQFWFRQAAAQGDAAGEFHVGLDYAQGFGVAQNYAMANRWYRRAAAQGNPYAQYDLAYDYQHGRGVAPSLTKANLWLGRAARGGLALAEYALGYNFGKGFGLTRDYATANHWFHRAAIQGFGPAEAALALDYELARGCARNLKKPISGGAPRR
ncbi:Sel1 domain protein repeat-containing protein, partial [mine drainage metagenome]